MTCKPSCATGTGRLVTGLRRPRLRILGTELAGVVEAAGPAVTEFTAGDEVFGVKAWTFGAHALTAG